MTPDRPGRLAPEQMYPAGEPGISVRYVVLARGIRLRVLEAGSPGGDAVVLLHGWGACVYSFDALIPPLARAGYRVVAFDLPGHGLSDKPGDDHSYSTDALVETTSEVLSRLGVRDATVVGHSMGGAIALHLALGADSPVRRLVLISPVGLGGVPLMWLLRAASPVLNSSVLSALLTRANIRVLLHCVFRRKGRPTERDVDEYWAPSQFHNYTVACLGCVRRFDWRPVGAAALRGIRVPTLVINGGRDLMVRGAGRRARMMPSARTVTVPRGGHVVLQECFEETVAQLLSFLSSGP